MASLRIAVISLLACTVAVAKSIPSNEDASFDVNYFLKNPELYDKRSRGEADLDMKFDDSWTNHPKGKAQNDIKDKSPKDDDVFKMKIVFKTTPVVTNQCNFLFLIAAVVFGACIVIYFVAEVTKPKRQPCVLYI